MTFQDPQQPATQDDVEDAASNQSSYPQSPTRQPYRGPMRVRRSDGQREFWVEGRGYVPENSPYRLSPKEQQTLAQAQTAGQASGQMLPLLDRFQQVNRHTPTGAVPQIIGQSWPFGAIHPMLGDPNVDEMLAVTNKLTPLARSGLPGSASNLDVQMFRGALPSIQNVGPSNDRIIGDLRTQARQAQAYAEFLDWYWPQHGASLNGAAQAWNSYITHDPQMRRSWREALGAQQGGASNTGSSDLSHLSTQDLARLANGGQ